MEDARLRPPGLRQAITIYCRWQDPANGHIRPHRRVLHNAAWIEQGNTVARNTGIILAESAFIQCFLEEGMEYVPLHAWKTLAEEELEGKWAVDIMEPQTIIVDHECGHEFQWGTHAQTTAAENAFIAATPGARRVAQIEPNLRGTIRGRHILLRC